MFRELIETERSSISNRSVKLFTLSGVYNATKALLKDLEVQNNEEKAALASNFWNEVAKHIADWQLAKDRKVSAADLRRDYIHSHTLALAALARTGNELLRLKTREWKAKLRKLRSLDWSRSNTDLWEGRAMTAGRLSKRIVNVTLTGNLIKEHLGLELNPGEAELEEEFRRNKNASQKRAG